MGALFAAQQNSGINAAYVLVYLSCNPDWAAKARTEALTVARKYCPDESLSMADRLAMVPVEAWESELPTIELCLRDSIRMHSLGACFRKNIGGKDIDLGTGIIPNEYFASYHISNVHLNPEIYRDPEQWDPSRYLPDRAEDKKRPLAWLGWGAGRHPCLGMKVRIGSGALWNLLNADCDYSLRNLNKISLLHSSSQCSISNYPIVKATP